MPKRTKQLIMVSALLTLFSNQSLALNTLNFTNELINQASAKQSANLLLKGSVAILDTDTLSASDYNPAVLAKTESFKSESNLNTLAGKFYFYQNFIAVPTHVGNFAASISYADNNEEFMRWQQLYAFSFNYATEFNKSLLLGINYASTPWTQSISLGTYFPLKSNITIFKRLGVWNLAYAAAIRNITISKAFDLSNLNTFLSQGLEFYTLLTPTMKIKNSMQIDFSSDFLSHRFHLGVEAILFNYFFIGAGGHGKTLMSIDQLTYGGGLKVDSSYLNMKAAYAQESAGPSTSQPNNHAFSIQFSFTPMGQPSRKIQAKIAKQRISPRNNDGNNDFASIDITSKETTAIKFWQLVIYDEENDKVRTISSAHKQFKKEKVSLPEKLSWNGRDDLNSYVPDGRYQLRFFYFDKFNRKYYRNLPVVIVDNTPPSARVVLPSSEIKIKKDGSVDTFSLQLAELKTEPDDNWKIEIKDQAKNTVRFMEYSGSKVSSKINWDVRDNFGKLLEGGKYSLVVTGKDRSANVSSEINLPLTIVDLHYRVSLVTSQSSFSPNNDGIADEIECLINYEVAENINNWKFQILSSQYKPIKVVTGKSSLIPKSIVFNGYSDNEKKVADGVYYAELIIFYKNKRVARSLPQTIVIDTQPPLIDHAYTPQRFSPDGDGRDEIVAFQISLKAIDSIEKWKLDIVHENGLLFRSFEGYKLPKEKILWDGTDQNGQLVKSLTKYSYSITMQDKAGNTSKASGGIIEVDLLLFRVGNIYQLQTFGIIFGRQQMNLSESIKGRLEIIGRLITGRLRNYKLIIEGHSDLNGSEKRNYFLALKRAESVREYLVKNFSVDQSRLKIMSKGMTEPLTRIHTPEAQAKNRRVTFLFYKEGNIPSEEQL